MKDQSHKNCKSNITDESSISEPNKKKYETPKLSVLSSSDTRGGFTTGSENGTSRALS